MQEVMVVGCGRSGRGMIGEMAYSYGIKPIFCDINSKLIEGLKKQGYYSVNMSNLAKQTSKETVVDCFDTIDVTNNYREYIEKMATSKYVFSALLPDDFPAFSKAIYDNYVYRKEHKITNNQYIFLGANYVGMRQKVEGFISHYLKDGENLNENNCYVLMSLVNRKNLLPEDAETNPDKYRIVGDDKPVLKVDDFDKLMAEDDIPGFMRFEANLDGGMAIKIWTGNVVQCTMAFVALDKNMQYTDEAVEDPEASLTAYYASKEAYSAVKLEYNAPERDEAGTIHSVTLFRNPSFRDSLYRITREPKRKLKKDDRFVGPALCCLRHNILPYYIALGLAYGYKYYNPKEADTIEINNYIKENGIEKAVEKYSQLDVNVKDEKILLDLVVAHYNRITDNNPTKE